MKYLNYRVYFPGIISGSKNIWPYWEGMAGGYNSALELAMQEGSNVEQKYSLTEGRPPKNGELVAVLNIADPSNALAIFEYVAPEAPPASFERVA